MGGASLFALMGAAGYVHAAAPAPAPADATAAASVEEVIVTGTRETGIRAADSPAPIQMVGHAELLKTGTTDLAQSLTTAVPSLNISTSNADSAAVQVLAALRGLSPNDTLVLVDGKRRHTTSNIAVDTGSVYTGSAATDLSFIPVDAIDHVEVLTDGAAAQYGSDAIAGVINIILKKSATGGTLDLTGGRYYDGYGSHGNGETGAIGLNMGWALGDRGFLNLTAENRYHNFSTTGIGDNRVTDAQGNLTATGTNAGVLNFPGYPYVNALNGDPQFNLYNGFYNMGYDLSPEIQIYSFGNFGYREAQHFENIRLPTKVSGVPQGSETTFYPFPYGFDPKEKFDEKDYSFTAGVRGKVATWNYDLSGTYGGNTTDVYVVDSGQADLFPLLQALSPTPIVPQTTFYDGKYKSTELTLNADVDNSFAIGLAAPLNVAFGLEYRRDTFGIGQGEPSSFFGAGTQSFAGYTPTDQGDYSRTNFSAYVDFATDPVKNLHIDLAGRFEHYSDFGDTEVGKFTARYDFTPQIAIRGTVSTGFRAPTLAEEHYSGTNVAPSFADVVVPANSGAAVTAGFAPLKPEKSTNYSIGFVLHPVERMQITADAYLIELRDRILSSGLIYCSQQEEEGNLIVSQAACNAITMPQPKGRGVTLDSGISYSGISLFANAANTRTEGLDVTANYASDFGDYGHVDWSVGFNYDKTDITKTFPLPADLVNVGFGQTTFFTKNSLSALTTSVPREKLILNGYWTIGAFSVNLRETIYGPSQQWSGNNAILLQLGTTGITDLDVGYRFNKHVRLDIGANDLFNHKPPTVGPEGGGHVFAVPYSFAGWNQNGGYYYGRVQVTW
ncbi:MAG TPA: TonB-dependent receptor [Caulobacteraceae bacterium]|nr:TonB-dependent receptor [Caulobacteraceae bacterium]